MKVPCCCATVVQVGVTGVGVGTGAVGKVTPAAIILVTTFCISGSKVAGGEADRMVAKSLIPLSKSASVKTGVTGGVSGALNHVTIGVRAAFIASI
jgi:hypothetical protein